MITNRYTIPVTVGKLAEDLQISKTRVKKHYRNLFPESPYPTTIPPILAGVLYESLLDA